MDLVNLITFTAALSLAVASPGPGLAAVVARALGAGFWGAFPMVIGLIVGDLIYLTFAAFGLAAIAKTFGTLFLVVKYIGAAYLLFLAYKMWTSDPHGSAIDAVKLDSPLKTFLTGLSVTMGNPKVMVFYLALLPTLIDLEHLTNLGFAELIGLCIVVLMAIVSAYAAAAARARAVFRNPRALKLLNRGAGTMMAGAAVAVAVR